MSVHWWGGGFEKVSEREHGFGHGERVRDLIHQTEPCSDICDVLWGGELSDGVGEMVGWSDLCWGDYKSSKFDSALCKPELGGV